MNVQIRREGPRVPPPDFRRKLREYNVDYGSPEVAVVWNPESVKTLRGWDPRWEVWVEVADNAHPDHQYMTAKGDVVRDGKVWRFLNTWRNADDTFAPLDDRFFKALRGADTWADSEYYRKNVLAPEEANEREQQRLLRDASRASHSYYKRWDNPVIGAGTRGDWRSKMFWR